MIKKFISVFMIFALIFNAQIQTANAVFFVPSAIAWAVGAGASTVMQTQIRNAAIGTVIAGVGWYAANTPDTNSQKKDYPVYIPMNPRDPLEPPAGWTPATSAQSAAGDINPNPPSTVPLAPSYKAQIAGCSLYYLDLGAAEFCQKSAFAAQWFQYLSHSCSATSVTSSLVSYSCTATATASNSQAVVIRSHYITVGAPYICPAGYVVNASACTLSDKTLVPYPASDSPPYSMVFDGVKNGTCEITRTGNVYQSNSKDHDCASASPSMSAAANGGSIIVQPDNVTSISEDGKKVTVVMNPDGSQTVTTFMPNSATNTTDVETYNISAPDALSGEVKLTGKSSSVVSGTGTAADIAATQKVDVTFPSDYARAGEAVDAAGMLVQPLNNISDALITPASETPDPIAVNEAAMPTFDTTFDNLKGWQLPAHSSTCTAQSLVLFEHTYSFDAICHYLQPHYNTIHNAMIFTFSVIALFVVLGA